jgi:hypothetical protein
MRNNLLQDLKELNAVNDQLSCLLAKLLGDYTKAELLEMAVKLNIPVPPNTGKWRLLQILCLGI